jgi:NitT/TauT family transport system permease protein
MASNTLTIDATPNRDHIASLEAGLDALEAPVSASTRPSSTRRVLASLWPPLLAIFFLICAWWLAYELELKPPYALPSPAAAWQATVDGISNGATQTAIANSLQRAFIGFTVAVAIGTVVGLLLTRSSIFRRAFGPLITGLQILPSVAWVPAAIIWFGLSNGAMLFVVIMGATPSIANGIRSGVDQIPTLYPKVGTMLGTGTWTQIRYVTLPAALPGYLAGLRQGWAFAWRSLMAAELIVFSPALGLGLGQILDQNRTLGDMPGVVATIIAILAVGILVELCIFAPLERRVLRQRGLLPTT